MKTRLLGALLSAGLLMAPFTLSAGDSDKPKDTAQKNGNQSQDSDMQRAIAFEHYKDVAAARQARMEAKHPTVFYTNADRAANPDEDATQGKKVIPKDPDPKGK
jgi:hypothetical protein